MWKTWKGTERTLSWSQSFKSLQKQKYFCIRSQVFLWNWTWNIWQKLVMEPSNVTSGNHILFICYPVMDFWRSSRISEGNLVHPSLRRVANLQAIFSFNIKPQWNIEYLQPLWAICCRLWPLTLWTFFPSIYLFRIFPVAAYFHSL